jgi:hypothetical protein
MLKFDRPVIYEHTNYGGRSQELSVGRYDYDQLAFGNDMVSSVKVPLGWSVNLYQHAGFQGALTQVYEDTPELRSSNDTASSIEVFGYRPFFVRTPVTEIVIRPGGLQFGCRKAATAAGNGTLLRSGEGAWAEGPLEPGEPAWIDCETSWDYRGGTAGDLGTIMATQAAMVSLARATAMLTLLNQHLLTPNLVLELLVSRHHLPAIPMWAGRMDTMSIRRLR